MPFEPDHGEVVYRGEAVVELLDPTGLAPINIIKATDAFKVKVAITFKGGMAGGHLNNAGVEWLLQAFVDNIGPPWHQEKQIGADKAVVWNTFTTNPGPPAFYTYSIEIDVPAGTLLKGLYRLGVVITSRMVSDHTISGDTYGFTEGPAFQIA